MMSDEIDYSELDPGIRDVVRVMREAGFDTTDSGDGVSKPKDGMCVLEYPHVFAMTEPARMVSEADRLVALLGPEWDVDVSYSPRDGKAILSAAKMDPVAIWNARAEPFVPYAMNITGLTPEQIAAAEADPNSWVKRDEKTEQTNG
jgi:hypothetical protein